jgi:nitronate monooxygenase
MADSAGPRFSLDALEHPIVQAPLAGGPSTPALTAAVGEAGGFGFLAAGYKTVDQLRSDIEEVRRATDRPFGVNLFVPTPQPADPALVRRYAAELAPEAERHGVALGEPRFDDDCWAEKLALVIERRVAVVSFTFGCPEPAVVDQLHAAGASVWATVTTAQEALAAEAAGADVLVAQGVEAGGHRASFDDRASGEIGLLALLQLVRAQTKLPMVASGGIATGAAIAAVLAAGAVAAQLGTAFMLTPEAGTTAFHRDAISGDEETALTRAFTGRLARGISNRFLREHSASAPTAYPEVHYLTSPLRAAARAVGDPEAVNLWAGQAHQLTQAIPAGDLVRQLGDEARAALREACGRWS